MVKSLKYYKKYPFKISIWSFCHNPKSVEVRGFSFVVLTTFKKCTETETLSLLLWISYTRHCQPF